MAVDPWLVDRGNGSTVVAPQWGGICGTSYRRLRMWMRRGTLCVPVARGRGAYLQLTYMYLRYSRVGTPYSTSSRENFEASITSNQKTQVT